jgi:hypothetical protein
VVIRLCVSGLTIAMQGYTPQQALDIVTTMSNVPNQTVGQFNQGQLPMNQDLTLQASIEAGIAPPDSYVNGAGMTETQLLENVQDSFLCSFI